MTKVLLIEDDTLVRHALRISMEMADIEVIEADHGKRGLDRFRQSDIDVIVTDVFMPEMDGIEFLMETKKCCPDTPVIVISGGGSVDGYDYLESAEFLGAAAVFAKPFDERDLIAKIEDLACPAA